MKVNVKRRITGPDAPALGPVLTISSTALTVTLDRPATGPTRIELYELYRSTGGGAYTLLVSGIDIFGAANAFPDTGLLPSTEYSYRCRAKDTTGRYSEYSTISGTTSSGAVNSAPVWGTVDPVTIAAGSGFSVAGDCSDPEGNSVAYSLVSVSPSSTKFTVSLAGFVSIDVSTAAGVYEVTVRGSDGLLSADKTYFVTVTVDAGTDTDLTYDITWEKYAAGSTMVVDSAYGIFAVSASYAETQTSAKIASTPTFSGARSARMFIDKGTSYLLNGVTRKSIGEKIRSEFKVGPGFTTPYEKRWIGFSMLFPTTGFFNRTWPYSLIVAQIVHHTLSGGEPDFVLNVAPDRTLTFDHTWEGGTIADSPTGLTVVADEWIDVVAELDMKVSGGRVTLWINGSQVYQRIGSTLRSSIASVTGQNLISKLGLYPWSYANSLTSWTASPQDSLAFYDSVRLGGPNSDYSTMVPR